MISLSYDPVSMNDKTLYNYVQRSTDFPKILEPPSNSRRQKGCVKQVSYWGPKFWSNVWNCYLAPSGRCVWSGSHFYMPDTASQAMYVQRDNEKRSCNHCCNGKAISITYCPCVFVALGIQREMAGTILSSVTRPAFQYFPTFSHKWQDFR